MRKSVDWLLIGAVVATLSLSGCMSVFHYHEIDGTTKTPYSGARTDLEIAASAISDPELRGTIPGIAILTMSAIDTSLCLIADTLMLPRDLRRSASACRQREEPEESVGRQEGE